MKKGLVALFLVIATLFTNVGYAELSDMLRIHGSAKVETPYGLFITEIVKKGESNINHESHTFVAHSTTVEAIIDKKDDTKTGSRPSTTTKYTGSISYEIKVYNNTEYEYAYRGLYYQKDEYHNSYIDTTAADGKIGIVTSFPNGSLVAPGETLSFNVTDATSVDFTVYQLYIVRA